jgi:NADH:ubiquinone oxidoreductase subunit 5 (subunit L)/multisubunit Na+/H+ antiporter MnhA subunit
MPADYAWLIPLFPLLASTWIALGHLLGSNRGEAAERQTARVAVGAATLSFLLAAVLGVQALRQGAPGQVLVSPWLVSGAYAVDIGFTLDALGLSLTLLVAFLSLLTVRFSVNYMHRDPGFRRFFLVLCLFMAAMETLVMAGNAGLVFVGWELAGVSSYLLIAYSFERPVATANANRAFITNRIGDAGFLLGIFLAFHWLGGIAWPAVAQGATTLDPLRAALIALAFVLAALAKSAQVPFAPWIGRALEGPTPSSALFYGSLMVHAGVYLLIRVEPVLQQAPAARVLVAALGLFTALYGWLCGLVQSDVKSALMFSTTAQVGLMFLWCGLGWTDLAAWHLGLHALWRGYQFLHAPSLMHRVSRPARPVPEWLRGRRTLYNAALHRFWLDPLADWLLVRPTRSLARDVQNLDEKVVSRAVGLPAQASELSSLADFEARKGGYLDMPEGDLVRGRGVLGRILEWAATVLHWFEEHMVLRGGGEGLVEALQRIGTYADRVEQLLSQPRYLWLLIMATFAVIL